MPSNHQVDEYPSMLWVTIPPFLLIAGYYVRKWYLARQLRVHGIGKGAPGFQTNVRKVRITPEIAARLRRGEDVSPEEIAEASRKAESEPTPPPVVYRDIVEVDLRPQTQADAKSETPVNEWLPESITSPKKRGKSKKK